MEKVKLTDISKSTTINSDFDVKKAVADALVKSTDDIGKANYIVKIDNVDKFSRGNISAFIGRAKSKKTFSLSMLAASVVSGLSVYGKFNPSAQGEIIIFDTEQSKYDVQVVVKRIEKLSGVKTNLKMYGLRSYSPEQRVLIIEDVLVSYGNNSSLVIIDGIRDLIYNINDAVESTNIMTKLMKWSEVYDLHISTVLHQNKGDGNARGHIGSELQNKAEVVIKITADEHNVNISHIEEVFGRGKGTLPFSFKIENSLPVVVDYNRAMKTETNPDDLPF